MALPRTALTIAGVWGQMRALDAVPLLLGCCAADGIDDGTGGGDADGRRRRKSAPSQ